MKFHIYGIFKIPPKIVPSNKLNHPHKNYLYPLIIKFDPQKIDRLPQKLEFKY